MRRPAVSAAAAFGTGITFAYWCGAEVLLWLVLFTISLIFMISHKLYGRNDNHKSYIILICIFVSGGLWMEIAKSNADPLMEMQGQYVEYTGTVKQISFKDDMYSIIVGDHDSKVLVKYYTERPFSENLAGTKVQIYGKVELPRQRSNPRCFDYRMYLRSCGIQVILKAEKITQISESGIKYLQYTDMIRNKFKERLRSVSGEETAGIITAIMFGEKSGIPEDIYNDFQKNGTAHVLAVSGLHTGILYAFFVMLWRFKKGTLFYCMVFTVLLLYMALAGFSPSVVRAACMIIIHLFSLILRCRYDLFTAAGITFILMVLNEPFRLFHTGFQLSFLAIASLAVILPFVKRFYEGVFLSAIAIQAGMAPYTAFLFNYVSAGAIVANIPVIFLAGIILPVGLCALIAAFFPGGIFEYLAVVLEVGCRLLVRINSLFYADGVTSFDIVSPGMWGMMIYYGVIFTLLSETGQIIIMRRKWRVVVKSFLCIIAAASVSVCLLWEPVSKAEITFVDVGQGDCIHVRTAEGRNYLIDGGGSLDYDTGTKVLKPYLLKNGVKKIDIAFVTHLHEDHYGGLRTLSADGMIDRIAMYEANRYQEKTIKGETGSELIYLHRGHKIKLGEDVYIEVISPEPDTERAYMEMIENEEDENASSLIMKLSYEDVTLLITGDIDENGEAELVEKYKNELDSDIMKVPHHGSRYSSSEAFIEAVSPEIAVFQVGKNNYGHPSPEIIERYVQQGAVILRNDTNGAIGMTVNDDGSVKVVDMIH